jgi:serine/threonine protein kinase
LHKIDGKVCAVKVVKVEDDISEVEKEVKILKQCKSPYIVGYHGTYLKNNKLWVRRNFFLKLSRLLLSIVEAVLLQIY